MSNTTVPATTMSDAPTTNLFGRIAANYTSTTTSTPGFNTTALPLPEQPFSYGGVIFSAVMLVPMAVFGLFANTVTMIVIAKSKTLKSIFNHLLLSLCLSDMLSALFSPLPLYRQTWGFEEWKASSALCKASFAVDAWTTYVTTLHILLFAIFRLISIQWPIAYKNVKVAQVRVLIVCIWIIGFGCGFMPYAIMFHDIKRNRYSNGPDATWTHCSLNPAWINEFITYYQVTYPIFIYFPMAAIIVLCPTIGIIIKKRSFKSTTDKLIAKNKWCVCPSRSPGSDLALMENNRSELVGSRPNKQKIARVERKDAEAHQRKKERNALLQLAFITGSFLMGYIPNTAHVVYTTNVIPTSMAMRVLEWNLYMMGYIFLRLSECLNPIFYNVASSKMRKETIEFLGNCCGCKCGNNSCASPPQSSQSNGSSNGNATTNMAFTGSGDFSMSTMKHDA